MRFVPAHRADSTRLQYITPGAREFFGCAALLLDTNATATTAWPSANKPVAIPFRISVPLTVTHLGWFNGSGAGSNHDIGIYRPDWSLVVAAGSTAGTGNTTWQWVDVSDTALPTGDYYLVKVINATTASRTSIYNTAASAILMKLIGVKESPDDSFPLPNPLTNMGDPSTFTRIHQVGMLTRAPF